MPLKKIELGLDNRPKGSAYSRIQRQRIKKAVGFLNGSGNKKTEALRTLDVCRSTHYGWFKEQRLSGTSSSVLSLTEPEIASVVAGKE